MISKVTEPPLSMIEDRAIDAKRPLRVICIGAGISGIITAIRFPQRIPNLDLQIYEKNADISGTWYENKYPGCACDIPAHTYQLTFEPNHNWSQFYAKASEIHQYWKDVAKKYDCMKYIKLGHKVVEARWDADQGKWLLQIQDAATGTDFVDSCDVLISATGVLNDWKWPNIPGLHSFEGKLLHSATWDQGYDYSGQKVAVIGAGSSGIQIVPGILPKVAHIDHYVRGKTWIATPFAAEKVKERGAGLDNFSFTEEDIRRFKSDPVAYKKFQKEIELELQSAHGVTIRGSKDQTGAREAFTQHMKSRAAKKASLLDQLLPDFPPCCRRLTPGPGYLEALTADNVDVISESIVKIVADGIITSDGKHRPVDAIACATGFDTTFNPRFPIYGKNGVLLADKWKTIPETYMSLATDGFPSYFMYLGPNSALGTGNLLLLIERLADYFTDCLAKMQRDNVKSMEVREEPVERFVKHCDEYFQRAVFTMNCNSWYKGGTNNGRVSALWPGSSLHAVQALANPRWEDYRYEFLHENANGWFGDGWTENEKNKSINVDYLDYENIDFPSPAVLAVNNGNGHSEKTANGLSNGVPS